MTSYGTARGGSPRRPESPSKKPWPPWRASTRPERSSHPRQWRPPSSTSAARPRRDAPARPSRSRESPRMRVNILGGGPGGLYFAALLKKSDPSHQITVIERDGPDDTFGWGIVFSDRTLTLLRDHDEETYRRITRACQTWDNVDVVHRGERLSLHGNGFSGIARLTCLRILRQRCLDLGVAIRFRTAVTDPAEILDCDLLLGADGAHSLVRRTYADFFQPSVDIRENPYARLGTSQLFPRP